MKTYVKELERLIRKEKNPERLGSLHMEWLRLYWQTGLDLSVDIRAIV